LRCARRQVSDIGVKTAGHSRNGPSRGGGSKIGCRDMDGLDGAGFYTSFRAFISRGEKLLSFIKKLYTYNTNQLALSSFGQLD
jgi:hypothetical protein